MLYSSRSSFSVLFYFIFFSRMAIISAKFFVFSRQFYYYLNFKNFNFIFSLSPSLFILFILNFKLLIFLFPLMTTSKKKKKDIVDYMLSMMSCYFYFSLRETDKKRQEISNTKIKLRNRKQKSFLLLLLFSLSIWSVLLYFIFLKFYILPFCLVDLLFLL